MARYWYDRGAAGDQVVELSWLDLLRLIWGREVKPGGCTVICLGKSRRECFSVLTREQQLGEVPCTSPR